MDQSFSNTLSEGGYLWAYAMAFGYGFLTSLTPCVYPTIGITVSVFGARSVKRRRDGFLLASAFVLGIAVMYSSLGVIAGLGGMMFGAILAHPAVVVGIAVLLVALALSLFDLYEFTLPASWQTRLSGLGAGGGYVGSFLMGLVTGIVAAPCTGPFLLGILAYISTTGSPLLGFSFLFVYALGMGVLFLVLGTFAVSLPKGGRWMVSVRAFLGCVLVATAGYFLIIPFPALGEWFRSGWAWLGIAAGLAAAGAAIGGLHLPLRGGGAAVTVRKAAGLLLLCAGLFGGVSSLVYAEPLAWREDSAEAQRDATEGRRPLLVDVTARWCGVCKEIERDVFADAAVRREIADTVLLKVDLSTDPDRAEGGAVEVFGVAYTLQGLPRILLFDRRGELVADFNGPPPDGLRPPTTPEAFLEPLRRALAPLPPP
jgi:thiol:disulfide interchange protein DsbD